MTVDVRMNIFRFVKPRNATSSQTTSFSSRFELRRKIYLVYLPNINEFIKKEYAKFSFWYSEHSKMNLIYFGIQFIFFLYAEKEDLGLILAFFRETKMIRSGICNYFSLHICYLFHGFHRIKRVSHKLQNKM